MATRSTKSTRGTSQVPLSDADMQGGTHSADSEEVLTTNEEGGETPTGTMSNSPEQEVGQVDQVDACLSTIEGKVDKIGDTLQSSIKNGFQSILETFGRQILDLTGTIQGLQPLTGMDTRLTQPSHTVPMQKAKNSSSVKTHWRTSNLQLEGNWCGSIQV
jgi:hypothetical protein